MQLLSAFISLEMRLQTMRPYSITQKAKMVPALQCFQETSGKAAVSIYKDEGARVNTWVLDCSIG